MRLISAIVGESKQALRDTIEDLRRDLGEANKARAAAVARAGNAERDAADQERRADALSECLDAISKAVTGRDMPGYDLLIAVKNLVARDQAAQADKDDLTHNLNKARERAATAERAMADKCREFDGYKKVGRKVLEACEGRAFTDDGEAPPWADLPVAVQRVANEARNLTSRLVSALDANGELLKEKAELEQQVQRLRAEVDGWKAAAGRADADRDATARELDGLRDAVRVAQRALDVACVPPAPEVDVAGDPVETHGPWAVAEQTDGLSAVAALLPESLVVVGGRPGRGKTGIAVPAEPTGVCVKEGCEE